jgi:hypothetical protein
MNKAKPKVESAGSNLVAMATDNHSAGSDGKNEKTPVKN